MQSKLGPKGTVFNNLSFWYRHKKQNNIMNTMMEIIFWHFLLPHKFSFHHKRHESILLVIKMVYKSCFTS